MLHALIMAGGGGTRFWPQPGRTPQAIPAAHRRTHAAATHRRAHRSTGSTGMHLGHDLGHRDEVIRQLLKFRPTGHQRTLPARHRSRVSRSAALIARRGPAAVMLVLPSIAPSSRAGVSPHLPVNQLALHVITRWPAGIKPARPSTGYGYVRRGNRCRLPGHRGHTRSRFRENRTNRLPEIPGER